MGKPSLIQIKILINKKTGDRIKNKKIATSLLIIRLLSIQILI